MRRFSNESEIDSRWFSMILGDCQQFSMILSDSQISLKLILIDSQWFSNKSETDSQQFSMILGDSWINLKLILSDSQISLKLILNDSWWFFNKSETDSHWFFAILDDSWINLKLIFPNIYKSWGCTWRFTLIHIDLQTTMIYTWLERGDSQLQNGTLFVKIG